MRNFFSSLWSPQLTLRVDIQESIYDTFVEKVTKLVGQMRQGSASDCGSMTMPAQVDIVEAAVKDAVEKGAKIALGGKRNAALGGTYEELLCFFFF